ncbi:hypothetical protein Dimus_030786 [Dionaea muscipula]
MQVWGIWPSSGGSLRLPQVESHLDFSCFWCLGKNSRKRLDSSGRFFTRGSPGIILAARTLSGNGHGDRHWTPPLLHLGIGIFSRSSTIEVAFLGHPSTCSFGTLVTLAWALENQIVVNHGATEDCEENLKLTNESEDDNVGFYQLKRVTGTSEFPLGGNGNLNDDGYGEGIRNGDDLEEDTGTRINVRELVESLKLAKTVEDIEEVLKDKGKLPLQVYPSMIRVLGREKKLNTALAVVEWVKMKSKEKNGFDGPNVFVYNSLVGAVKQSEQFEKVEEVMKDMTQNGIAPDIVTYNTLMSIYLEQGRPIDAVSLFENLQSKGLSPSPASYSTALLAYRRMEDGFGAIKLFCNVKEKFMKGELGCDDEDWATEFVRLRHFIGRVCYQVMRRWLVKDGNMTTDVLKLLMCMDEAGVPPSREEHERLIWACTREQHYTVVKELYSRLRERNYEVSLSVCNHAIWLMGKAKKWWAALEIYEGLLEKGPKPNNMSQELITSHFNVLLTAARRRGIWRWGVRLLDKMEEKGLKSGNKEWNAVLLACSKSSETAAAVQVFKAMVDRGLKPTIVSYGALLSALQKGKQYDKAVQVWEHMIKIGIKPNIYVYTIMVSVNVALGKFHIVDLILQEMISTGINPTVVTFNAIISGCARNGWGGAAYEWFNRMRVQSISADEITYEMLIEALAKDAKPKIAYEMYLRARKEGLIVSSKAYDAVIHSSQTAGASIERSLMGTRPPEKKKAGANPKVG